MTKADEFIEENAQDGYLEPEQAAKLIELAMGETGAASPENGSAPSAAPAAAEDPAKGEEVKAEGEPAADEAKGKPEDAADGDKAKPEAEQEVPGTPIKAKDGVHTIEYSRLEEARKQRDDWKSQAEAAQAELERLKAEAQARADAGEAPTQTDANAAAAQAAINAGVDPAIFGDMSEEALAKGIDTLVNQRVAAAVAAQVAEKLKPIEAKEAESVRSAHYSAILEKHPDAESIVQSREMADWVGKQPSYAQAAIQAVIDRGSAEQVIELLDQFKAATSTNQPAKPTAEDAKAKAKAIAAAAKTPIPASLSDIPGGVAASADPDAALLDLDPVALSERMQSMTPAQIERFLNRAI